LTNLNQVNKNVQIKYQNIQSRKESQTCPVKATNRYNMTTATTQATGNTEHCLGSRNSKQRGNHNFH